MRGRVRVVLQNETEESDVAGDGEPELTLAGRMVMLLRCWSGRVGGRGRRRKKKTGGCASATGTATTVVGCGGICGRCSIISCIRCCRD